MTEFSHQKHRVALQYLFDVGDTEAAESPYCVDSMAQEILENTSRFGAWLMGRAIELNELKDKAAEDE